MTDKEFELELERRFNALFLARKAAWEVYKAADDYQRDLNAKLHAMAAMLWGEKAQEFIKGYPENGKPHLNQKG